MRKKSVKTWVLIADGARARILQADGESDGLQLVPGCEFGVDDPPDRDIDADKPGRTFDSVGSGRHGMEPKTSPHRHRKAEFARHLAEFLEKKRTQKAFERLLIAAAPVTLGDLRQTLSKGVKAAIGGEVAKDLTGIPDREIADHLGDLRPGKIR